MATGTDHSYQIGSMKQYPIPGYAAKPIEETGGLWLRLNSEHFETKSKNRSTRQQPLIHSLEQMVVKYFGFYFFNVHLRLIQLGAHLLLIPTDKGINKRRHQRQTKIRNVNGSQRPSPTRSPCSMIGCPCPYSNLYQPKNRDGPAERKQNLS